MVKVPYNFKDLRGQKIGRLTIIERGPDRIQPSGQKKTRWWCECICGNMALIETTGLLNGHTQSCGCLQREATSKAKKKYNHYEFRGGVVHGYTSAGYEFIFDEDDFDLVSPYCWNSYNNGYIWSSKAGQNIALHRLIMQNELGEKLYVDHINHDPSDNRKCNLRVVTHLDNMHNLKRSEKNTSGVTGVYLNKRTERWYAQIVVDRKTFNLGTYADFSDAVAARKAAEEKYFGQYSYDNSIAAVPRIDAHVDQLVRAAG